MTASPMPKKEPKPVRFPVKKSGKKIDAKAFAEEALQKYPRIMAELAK